LSSKTVLERNGISDALKPGDGAARQGYIVKKRSICALERRTIRRMRDLPGSRLRCSVLR